MIVFEHVCIGSHPSSAMRAGERNMNQDTTDVDWNRFLCRVMEQWERLTEDDLDQLGGREELVAAVQRRYRVSKEEAERQVQVFENSNLFGRG